VWRSGMQAAKEASKEAREAAALEEQVRRKGKSQAITKLKLAFAKITRGETGMRVYIWRCAVKAVKDAEAVAVANKLASRMKAQGLNKLKDTMMRIARGKFGMLLYVWGCGVQSAKQAARDATEASQLERSMGRMRSQAFRKLKVAFARITRGEIGMRVYLWKSTVRAVKDAEMANKLASRMKAQGLTKLKDTMMRIARGQVGMLLYVWGSQVKRDAEASKQRRMAGELEARLGRTKSLAIGKLKVAFAKITRGETGMRVYIWRARAKAATGEAQQQASLRKLAGNRAEVGAVRQMANLLAVRMKAQGLNKLRDTLARAMRGRVGQLLYVWSSKLTSLRFEMKEFEAAMELERNLGRMKAQAVSRLKAVMGRVLRGGSSRLLYIWRANSLREGTDMRIMKSVLMHLDFIGYGTTLGTKMI